MISPAPFLPAPTLSRCEVSSVGSTGELEAFTLSEPGCVRRVLPSLGQAKAYAGFSGSFFLDKEEGATRFPVKAFGEPLFIQSKFFAP
jgi:hypothetical protein